MINCCEILVIDLKEREIFLNFTDARVGIEKNSMYMSSRFALVQWSYITIVQDLFEFGTKRLHSGEVKKNL